MSEEGLEGGGKGIREREGARKGRREWGEERVTRERIEEGERGEGGERRKLGKMEVKGKGEGGG